MRWIKLSKSRCCSVTKRCLTLVTSSAHQASLSFTTFRSLLKLMSIQSVMPSNHLVLCRPPLLPPSIFPSIRVLSNESALCIRWPKDWSFSFTISPFSEFSGLVSFQIESLISFDLLAVQGSLKSLSSTTVQKHKFFVLNLLYSPTLTSIRDYWKNHR